MIPALLKKSPKAQFLLHLYLLKIGLTPIKKKNTGDKDTNQIYLFSIEILSQESCSGQNFIPLSFRDLIQLRSYHQQWNLVISKLFTVIVADEGNKHNSE